jgi:integrase
LAGVKYISVHGIRHSNTTWLLKGEHSMEEIGIISERLGHSNKTTTLNIYYHINKKGRQNILKTLSFLD